MSEDSPKLSEKHSARIGRIAQRLFAYYNERIKADPAIASHPFNWEEGKILVSILNQHTQGMLLTAKQEIFIKDLNKKRKAYQTKKHLEGGRPVKFKNIVRGLRG